MTTFKISSEKILIDGNLNSMAEDKLKILESYGPIVYIHKPNSTVYQGMNEGILSATGDYCWIINAGTKVLANPMEFIKDEDMYVFKTIIAFSSGMKKVLSPSRKKWLADMNHESVILKRKLGILNALHPTLGDLIYLDRAFKKSNSLVFINKILIEYEKGGLSDRFSLFEKVKCWCVMLSLIHI